MNIHLREYNRHVLYEFVHCIGIHGMNSSNEDNAYSPESDSVKKCRIHRIQIHYEM